MHNARSYRLGSAGCVEIGILLGCSYEVPNGTKSSISLRYYAVSDYALEEKITDLLAEFDIGWKVLYRKIEIRGDEPFERSIQTAREALEHAGRRTAKSELDEALADLSRRPNPDLGRTLVVRSSGR